LIRRFIGKPFAKRAPAKAMASGGLAVLCSLALLVEWRADPSPLPPQSVAALTPRLETPAQAAEPQRAAAPAAQPQLEAAPVVAPEALQVLSRRD
jgi:hypothetical protein